MSFFNAEINIPSNNGKSIQLRAHDGLSSNHSFFLPSVIGASGNILAITDVNGTDNIVGFTSDLSVNSVGVSNLNLNQDNSVISFGANSDITLTHVADTGLTLKNTNADDNSTVVLTLQTGETDIQANDVIGAINFQAPDEGTGGDANLICAGIEAISEGDFSSSNNATKLSFKTDSSGTATERAYIDSSGSFAIRQQTNDYHSGLTLIPQRTDLYANWTIFNWNNLNFTRGGTNMVHIKSTGGIGIRSQNFTSDGGITIEQANTGGTTYDPWSIFTYGNLNFYYGNFIKGYLTRHANSNNAPQINFTGQHRSIMNTNISESFVGLIVSSTGKFVNTDNTLKATINESLPVCVITTSGNDKKVFGVLSDKEDGENTRNYSSGNWVSVYNKQNNNEQRVFINSVGEGAIWVSNKNGILENGDYISSSIVPGYGMKQSDDLLHNYTVAKITCDCDFSTTKIVKQKLKVISTTDTSGNAITEIDYDANGDVQYEDDLDASGNQQMVYPLETRFLEADGTQITEEQYTDKLANGENVYIACFVGCTYHCG